MTTSAPIRTRDLGPEDVAALAALALRLGSSETAEQWTAFLARPGAVAVGAVADGRVIGYAAGEIRGGFGLPAGVAWLDAFGIELERRGGGIGRTLIAELLARLTRRGATHVYTVVPLHDQVLAPFFRQVGFRDEPLSCMGRSL